MSRDDRTGRKETILIVEDDAPVAGALSRLLETTGLRVLTVPEPKEAIALISDPKVRVDLIVPTVVIGRTVRGHRAKACIRSRRWPASNTSSISLSASISMDGSPRTRRRSARCPGAIRPKFAAGSRNSAGMLVAARSAANGAMPSRTRVLSSLWSEAPGKTPCTPASVPTRMGTPAATSFRRFASVFLAMAALSRSTSSEKFSRSQDGSRSPSTK